MTKEIAKRPPGRPPIPIDLGELKRLAGLGMTVEHIADRFGVSRRSMFNLFNADPEARRAFDSGGAEAEERAVTRLEKAAMAGNLTADIFFLKARRGWKTDPQPTPPVVINLENQPPTLLIQEIDEMFAEQRALIEGSASLPAEG